MARQEAMKDNKSIFDAKEIGEDESKRNEKDIDVLVKTMNDKIEKKKKNKADEVMSM
jgi:ribosome recycling factor